MCPTASGRRRQGSMPSSRCGKRWSFDSVRLASRPGIEGPRDVPSRPGLARAIVVCGTAVALLSPTILSAQSLAGVARQEQARRESMTRLSRVYTNDDLSNRGGLTISGVPPGTTTRHVDTPEPVVPPAEEPAEDMVRLVSAEPGRPCRARAGCRGHVLWPVIIGGGVPLLPILLSSGPPVLGQGPGPLETLLTRGRTRTAAFQQRSAARRLRLTGSSSMAPARVRAPRRNPPIP